MERGALVAAALAGSWRVSPPPSTLSAGELEQISPLLLEAGCGAVAWWRIRGSSVADSAVGEQLRDAYRLHTLQAAIHERELSEVVRALQSARVEALVVKGWTAARLYAESGLRPYGDIDVCVAQDHHSEARAVLADSAPAVDLDLHEGFAINRGMVPELPSFEEAWRRAAQVSLAGVDVRVLAPEDHLTLLCVHLLRHGAWRPLWLCDIAAALERLPEGFDWARCLGRTRRLATWVTSTLALAERLLGAQVADPPPAQCRAPRWLERAVLRQWGSARAYYPGDLVDRPMAEYIQPARAARTVRAHWVDPITATMFPGASFNALPRLPFQVRFVAWKAARFVRRATAGAPVRTSSPCRRGSPP